MYSRIGQPWARTTSLHSQVPLLPLSQKISLVLSKIYWPYFSLLEPLYLKSWLITLSHSLCLLFVWFGALVGGMGGGGGKFFGSAISVITSLRNQMHLRLFFAQLPPLAYERLCENFKPLASEHFLHIY